MSKIGEPFKRPAPYPLAAHVIMPWNDDRIMPEVSETDRLAGGHRNLAPVLAKAQQTLRYTMGMELYEMPAKWKMADQVAVATAQLAAEQSQSQSQNQSQSRAQTQSRSLVQSQSQSARGIITAMRKGKGRARPSGLETLEEEDEEEEEEDEDGDEDEGSGRNGAQSAQLQVEAGATPTKKGDWPYLGTQGQRIRKGS